LRQIVNNLIAATVARLLRILRYTWRIQYENKSFLDDLYDSDKHVLVCFWHGEYIPIFPLLEGYNATAISNSSLRGNIITEICKCFGYQVAQIPDETEPGSLLKLAKILSATRIAATPVDGPIGPYRKVKPGVMLIAARLNFEFLPVSVRSRRAIVLKNRWDQMEIPLPFTKVYLNFGKPVRLPSRMSSHDLKIEAEALATTITDLGMESHKRVRDAQIRG